MSGPLLIHVGFHKTATTWLQREVFDPGRLGFRPICEAPGPRGPDSMSFGWEFLCGAGERPDWGGRLASPFDFDADALKTRLDRLRTGPGVGVISHEDLCGHMMAGGMAAAEIAGRLHAVAPDARILVTIREQVALIHSSYSHFLRAGGICGLDRFLTLHNEYQTPFFDPAHLRFDRFAAHYRGLFGADRVMVLPQEALTADPRAALAALADFAGASGAGAEAVTPERRINAADPREDMLNRLFPLANLLASPNNLNGRAAFGSTRWKGRAVRLLARATPRRLADRHLARQKARITGILGADFYAASNARLAETSGLDLAALGYRVTGGKGAPGA